MAIPQFCSPFSIAVQVLGIRRTKRPYEISNTQYPLPNPIKFVNLPLIPIHRA
jgi:hypothetical protein